MVSASPSGVIRKTRPSAAPTRKSPPAAATGGAASARLVKAMSGAGSWLRGRSVIWPRSPVTRTRLSGGSASGTAAMRSAPSAPAKAAVVAPKRRAATGAPVSQRRAIRS